MWCRGILMVWVVVGVSFGVSKGVSKGASRGVASGVDIEAPLMVGAWNVQRLGPTKMSNPEVVAVLVQVMRRYDIIVLQEVRDSTYQAPQDLLNALNSGLEDTYTMTMSPRVGRSSQKEQYVFYLRSSRASVVQSYAYPDHLDVFEYDPFVMVVEGRQDARLARWGLVTLHAKPSDAVKEIDALVDVYDDARVTTGIDDFLLLGDFNAGCTYVSGGDWSGIRLRTDTRFTWLISDHADTTSKGTSCPYDRMVVAGPVLGQVVYADTAGPFYFDEELPVASEELVYDVSDHYPVGVLLRGAVSPGVSQVSHDVSSAVSFAATPQDIAALGAVVSGGCTEGQEVTRVSWEVDGVDAVAPSLAAFQAAHPDLVPREAVSVVAYKVSQGVVTDATLHGDMATPASYTLGVICLVSDGRCTLSVTAPSAVN